MKCRLEFCDEPTEFYTAWCRRHTDVNKCGGDIDGNRLIWPEYPNTTRFPESAQRLGFITTRREDIVSRLHEDGSALCREAAAVILTMRGQEVPNESDTEADRVEAS